jgi:uncharacterized protein YbjT (DUF2867 family)
MTIAVTAPTGRVGSRVARLLVQAGVRPAVLVRDPGRLDPGLRDHVDVRRGDLTDAGFVDAATADVEALLFVVPEELTAADPRAVMDRITTVGAAAVRARRIPRVVLLSSVGAERGVGVRQGVGVERGEGVGLIDGLAYAERELATTGAALTVLRSGYYFSNLAGQLNGDVLTTTMVPDVPLPWVDPRDVGEVAAARLLSRDWAGNQVQAVHGPVDLTWREVAGILSAVLRREIRLSVIGDDELRASLIGAGMSPAAAEGVVGMTAGTRDGFEAEQPRTFLSTTPTSLHAWAAENLRPGK